MEEGGKLHSFLPEVGNIIYMHKHAPNLDLSCLKTSSVLIIVTHCLC